MIQSLQTFVTDFRTVSLLSHIISSPVDSIVVCTSFKHCHSLHAFVIGCTDYSVHIVFGRSSSAENRPNTNNRHCSSLLRHLASYVSFALSWRWTLNNCQKAAVSPAVSATLPSFSHLVYLLSVV